MIPVQLIIAGVLAVASFGAAWTYQGNRYASILAERETDHALALAGATRDALAKTIALQEIANAAERKHQSRIADIRSDAARARGVADRLRNDLATARATLPSAACSAVREYTATVNELFGECAATAGRLAEAADGHAADALMLQQAWPVK